MADEAPAIPSLVPEAAPAAPVPAPVEPPKPPVAAAPPAPPRAPDSVTLTQRELDERISAAVLKAADTLRKERMSTEQPPKVETPEPKPPAEDPRIAKLAEEMAAIRASSEAVAKKLEESERALAEEKKARRRAKEKVVEAQLRAEAAQAGIDDVDYALVLYARAASEAVNAKDEKGEPNPQPPPQPDAFFAGLRQSKPSIFRVQPPATTAPADLPGSNGAPNPPTAPGQAAKGKAESVDEMDQREFNRRTLDKYNFNVSSAS